MPLSDMGRPVLRLVWRLKLGIPLGSRGERRTAPLHRQLIVGQTPRPSTNYRLGLQTWKFTSPLGSLFLLTISAGAQNVYDDWGPPNLDRVKFSGGAEDPALYISRLLGPSGRLKYLLWFLILKVLRDIRVFRLKE